VCTQTGFNYQLQHETHLTDATWQPLGSPIPGDGTVKSVNDPVISGGSRFYRAAIQ
jgi:hypothetical protein